MKQLSPLSKERGYMRKHFPTYTKVLLQNRGLLSALFSGNSKIVTTGLDFIPALGQVKQLLQGASGYEFLTWQKMNTKGRLYQALSGVAGGTYVTLGTGSVAATIMDMFSIDADIPDIFTLRGPQAATAFICLLWCFSQVSYYLYHRENFMEYLRHQSLLEPGNVLGHETVPSQTTSSDAQD